MLAAASLLGLAAPPAAAQSRCIESKLRAAGGYFGALAGCESKAYAKGRDVDPLCVAHAQPKLQKGFEKAAGKGWPLERKSSREVEAQAPPCASRRAGQIRRTP